MTITRHSQMFLGAGNGGGMKEWSWAYETGAEGKMVFWYIHVFFATVPYLFKLQITYFFENGFWYTLLLNLPQYVLLSLHRPLRSCHSRTNIPSHTLLMKPNGTEATNKIFVTGSNLCTCLSQQDCWLGTIQQEIKHPYKSTWQTVLTKFSTDNTHGSKTSTLSGQWWCTEAGNSFCAYLWFFSWGTGYHLITVALHVLYYLSHHIKIQQHIPMCKKFMNKNRNPWLALI